MGPLPSTGLGPHKEPAAGPKPPPAWVFNGPMVAEQALSTQVLHHVFRPWFEDAEWAHALAKIIRYTHFRLKPGFQKVWTHEDDRQFETFKTALKRQIYGTGPWGESL